LEGLPDAVPGIPSPVEKGSRGAQLMGARSGYS
jgi:hypothetical protein